ncbi:PQQ-binding-like beta-propeller repeat protein [Streptomyces cyaneofuscatus]|nr:PQQ-binding-like beta-propeller repeat protein [Streptomyces cyaneofuscatus]WOP13858.1 PQQ-binding-like beta-propeller repeat protein [Streptomyces cyaneofuscatus]
MYRGDAARTGVAGASRPPEGFLPWGAPCPGPVLAAPAVASGMVVVVDAFGLVTARNAISGVLHWRYAPEPRTPPRTVVTAAPVIHQGAVHFVSPEGGGRLLSLDLESGDVRWSRYTGVATAAPAAAGGLVFACAEGPRVCALSVEDGSEVWAAELGGYRSDERDLIVEVLRSGGQPVFFGSSPAVCRDGVYLVGPDGALYALAATDGSVRWRRELDFSVRTSCAVDQDRVYASDPTGVLHVLDAHDGRTLWTRDTGVDARDVVPVVSDGQVYVSGRAMSAGTPQLTSGAILAYDAATGAHKWSRPTGSWVAAPPAAGEGRVYLATRGSVLDAAELCALAATDGRVLWRRPVDHRSGHPTDVRWDGVRAAPTVHDGVLYLGLPDRTLRALDAATGIVSFRFLRRRALRRARPVGMRRNRFTAGIRPALRVLLLVALCVAVGGALGATSWWLAVSAGAAPLLMAAAQGASRGLFTLGVRAQQRGAYRSAALAFALTHASQLLTPPGLRSATHRVRTLGNLTVSVGQSGAFGLWKSLAAAHRYAASALARRSPGQETGLLRAQSYAMTAQGFTVFHESGRIDGTREAASYAARAVDLYRTVDAFSGRHRGEAEQANRLYLALAVPD